MTDKNNSTPLSLTDDEVSTLLWTDVIMTRLAVKPQPTSMEPAVWKHTDGHSGPGWYAALDEYPEEGSLHYRCPLGAVGGSVYVRESWYCDDYRCQEPPFSDEPPGWVPGEEEGMLDLKAIHGRAMVRRRDFDKATAMAGEDELALLDRLAMSEMQLDTWRDYARHLCDIYEPVSDDALRVALDKVLLTRKLRELLDLQERAGIS